MSAGEVRVTLKNIENNIKEIKTTLLDQNRTLHDRVDRVERCINQEVKPALHQNSADMDWIKRGFWFIAGVGSSALILVIGVIIKIAVGA